MMNKKTLPKQGSLRNINEEKEVYRELRVRLLITHPEIKVISIVSNEGEEEKAHAAMMLAASFGETGKNVVLVDANLRNPVLSRKTGDGFSTKLNSFLKGRGHIEDGIYPVTSNFYMISSEKANESTKLIEGPYLESIILDLKNNFDYIIINTLPFDEGIDALITSRLTEGVVYIVTENKTLADTLNEKANILAEAGIPVLGALFSRSR